MKYSRLFPGADLAALRILRRTLPIAAAAAVLLAMGSPAMAQKKKNKKDSTPASDGQPIIPMADEAQIDYLISGMLGAWQIGDVDRMHMAYADDVTIVNGAWAPPVAGWANYAPLYQQMRNRMQRVRMDRSNTVIKVAPDGTVGWACYQWEFSADVDGQPTAAEGQTTLVLEKRNAKWLIVLNHTSLAQMPPTTPAKPNPGSAAPAQQQSTRPPSK